MKKIAAAPRLKTWRAFYACVIPSVLAFALSGVYTIVDGFFVGRSVGDIGLSTINIAYPVVSLLQALGTGIGMGGAVMYTLLLLFLPRVAGMEQAGVWWSMPLAQMLTAAAAVVLKIRTDRGLAPGYPEPQMG